ncbi:AAA family ATPase [Aliikangiella sp. G2MR2-5]|uniref:AAA family ATPase n=1 Tax=Aliikangiella sp. G2MR2-5 TaxID=2788943 RepID=UPI0018ABBFBC|nr:AAA family ATPase [Aliikangiella sp. G2MR2-5]
MFLESVTIKNFRKFRDKNNTIYFVNSKAIKAREKEDKSSLIAPSSTLIIGKNNTGKTTVARALNLVSEKKKPSAYDFNMDYLRTLIEAYELKFKEEGFVDGLETPHLEFKLTVRVNINEFEDEGSDIVNNLYQFVSISSEIPDLVTIIVRCQIKEEEAFRNQLVSIINADYSKFKDTKLSSLRKLEKLCDFMKDDKLFKLTYHTASGVEVTDPSIGELIKVKEIKANRHLSDHVLSDIYQKIISSQFSANEEDKKRLGEEIDKINELIDNSVSDKGETITEVLKEIESNNHVGVGLSGDVTEDLILKRLIRYSFSEGEDYIPENQFGLGYVNLLNIIGEIIHYVDGYEDESFRNQINLLFIEEPEAFMHPQMQEFFITRIDSAVKKVLEISKKEGKSLGKELYCQIAITTHSSHIVNSKVHSCNSFDNINYLTSVNKNAEAVQLNDKIVCGEENYAENEGLKFIKKHIKYKVSELFFTDAVIFVEGVTEETVLQFYLDQNKTLRGCYISVFNINGAHGKLYYPLVKALKVPCLIVTDLDIKRMNCEKNKKSDDHLAGEECQFCGKTAEEEDKKIYRQIKSLKGRYTTNDTIKTFENRKRDEDGLEPVDKVELEGIEYFSDENLYVVFQKSPIEGQYATSFEEALILTNYNNDILNDVLKSHKPGIYKSIAGTDESKDLSKLVERSFELQRKLADSKSDFANTLLYKIIVSEGNHPDLPMYIKEGLEWLARRLDASFAPNGGEKNDSK